MTSFSLTLCNKVSPLLMKLYFYMVAYPEGLNGLSLCQANWCCSVPIVWVQIPQKVEQQCVSLKCNGYTRSLYLASFNLRGDTLLHNVKLKDVIIHVFDRVAMAHTRAFILILTSISAF
jgi:hypothetical protein